MHRRSQWSIDRCCCLCCCCWSEVKCFSTVPLLHWTALSKSSGCNSTPFKVAAAAAAFTSLSYRFASKSCAPLSLLQSQWQTSRLFPALSTSLSLSFSLARLFVCRLLLAYFKLERCKIQMPFKEWKEKKKKKEKRRPSFRAEFGPQVWKTVLAGCLAGWMAPQEKRAVGWLRLVDLKSIKILLKYLRALLLFFLCPLYIAIKSVGSNGAQQIGKKQGPIWTIVEVTDTAAAFLAAERRLRHQTGIKHKEQQNCNQIKWLMVLANWERENAENREKMVKI